MPRGKGRPPKGGSGKGPVRTPANENKTGKGNGASGDPDAASTPLHDPDFFNKMADLETTLRTVAGELKALGDTAARRMEEAENLATHALAVEAIVSVMLRKHPIDVEDVFAEIKRRTAKSSGEREGSTIVRSVAADLISRADGN